jgi:hypothetical protein
MLKKLTPIEHNFSDDWYYAQIVFPNSGNLGAYDLRVYPTNWPYLGIPLMIPFSYGFIFFTRCFASHHSFLT